MYPQYSGCSGIHPRLCLFVLVRGARDDGMRTGVDRGHTGNFPTARSSPRTVPFIIVSTNHAICVIYVAYTK
jgi:hypothetical protein